MKGVKILWSNKKPEEDKEMIWKHIVGNVLLFGVLCFVSITYNEWCNRDKSLDIKNLCNTECFCSKYDQFITEFSRTITRQMYLLISSPLPFTKTITRKVIHSPIKNYAEKESNGFEMISSL